MNKFRSIPSISNLITSEIGKDLIAMYGHDWSVQALREVLDEIRNNMDMNRGVPGENELFEKANSVLENWFSPTLYPVINATGVILHTNLGRAPLSQDAINSIMEIAGSYSTLEFSTHDGKRGSRLVHAENLLKKLSGAEAALIVNNNASSVLLGLTALARKKKVIIARSQLIEIGGKFRIPDVMKQAGAKLVEVGTTNKVRIEDYKDALEKGADMIMRAHHSNYKIIGFTSEPGLEELAELASEYQVPLFDDLGSGTFLETTKYGLPHEPTIIESLQNGADIVCFSGDKLLGGPQAGIILGKDGLIRKIKNHPMARAVRADKLCLAALNATLQHYIKNEAEGKIPVWKMISMPEDHIEKTALDWKKKLGLGEVIPGVSKIGGGSLPEEVLPTRLLAVKVQNGESIMDKLRKHNPAVIARFQDGKLLFDPRTVLEGQEIAFLETIKSVIDQGCLQ